MADRGIPIIAVNPHYLHTNSTNHKWPFSAVAELIDNAYDPDVNAKQLWIDKTTNKNQDCLVFMDNGEGMDHKKLFNMLSFGFCKKKRIGCHIPVGYYGNGFKAGSMRLGKDAIVFSKQSESMCVGLLSQTYLKKIKAENVMVPIVNFTYSGQIERAIPEHSNSLKDILEYSLFNTIEELLAEFGIINQYCNKSSGTRIIIWNLHKKSSKDSEEPSGEFDFTHDRYDIRLPVVCEDELEYDEYVPESKYSLRSYCSVLYLKPKMKIILRGNKVATQYISKSLARTLKDTYKPTFLKKRIVITFGYNTKNNKQYGLMMYNNNRLIKAYERTACQLKAESVGVGVIGVVECNHLSAVQNKQEFDDTVRYRKTMQSVSNKLEDYWKETSHRLKENSKCKVPAEDIIKDPDQNWVQCDDCQKWRQLPDDIVLKNLPETWYCKMNPDPEFRSCDKEETPEDSDSEQPGYKKTFKQHERNQKFLEMNRKNSLSPNTSSQTKQTFNVFNSTDSKFVDDNAKDISKITTLKRKIEAPTLKIYNKKENKTKHKKRANTTKSQHSVTFTASQQKLGHQSEENSTEEALYYKGLYLQAKERMQQLQDKINNLGESHECNKAPADSNELHCQIDDLLREIERKAINWEKLKEKVCSLKEEIKRLEKDLWNKNEKKANDALEISNNDTAIYTRLRQLITFIPTLNNQQVNYVCDVIDKVNLQITDDSCSMEISS